MNAYYAPLLTLVVAMSLVGCQTGRQKSKPSSAALTEAPDILQNSQQMTYSGKRSGEGYFDASGELMSFQSERDAANPFYQIYVMDLKTRKTHRVSPGFGKTTCSWIHPDKKQVIYSSTHDDPQAKQKMREELEFRASGKTRRYSWDYDEHYDIYISPIKGGRPRNLTKTLGYDAEASISPDGKHLVFASNRQAYAKKLSADDQKRLDQDPSYFLDLYIMDIDGRNLRQLTTSPGYDGGPFFSPNGEEIVWRRFSPDGHTAEIFTMNLKTGQERQITQLGVMSWAPYFHPSGDYIIFTSNLYGYSNFELFIVDRMGEKKPVRVTRQDGFDGLPVFHPNGRQITWNRKNSGDSQIFQADWNDHLAREALGLPKNFPMPSQLNASIQAEDAQAIVSYLASEKMKGRATGSPEEKLYSEKIGQFFKELGLQPLSGSYHQDFQFSGDSKLAGLNELTLIASTDQSQDHLVLNKEWRPLSFSKSGASSASEIVFSGYGIVAPEIDGSTAYNSYEGLDVKDKWVMFFRYVPEETSPERRQHLLRYARLEHKILVARQLGALGAIVIYGPSANANSELLAFRQASSSPAGLLSLSISNDIAEKVLRSSQKKLKDLQAAYDREELTQGFPIPDQKISAQMNIIRTKAWARNTLGLLKVPGAKNTLVIGAHGDHLGQGSHPSSTKKSSDKSDIHYGADDNASGMAGVLEVAHWLKNEMAKGISPRQNILFAIWSGEELGNLGSAAFTQKMKSQFNLKVSGYLNLDMIGRLTDQGKIRPLQVQGVASSQDWLKILERHPSNIGLRLSEDPYLPTDAMSFYLAGVPVLSFFSGVHSDYHSPRDTGDKVDYRNLQEISQYVAQFAKTLAWEGRTPQYNKVTAAPKKRGRGFRIFLGTIPDYGASEVKGVKLSGVIEGGPAEKAGLKDGDVIVKLAEFEIKTIHDYVYSLETMKPNQKTQVVVLRDGKAQTLEIVPKSRE